MSSFIQNSNVTKMIFRPHFLAVNHLLQGAILMIIETIEKVIYKVEYDEELIKTEDGGTVGIGWSIDNGVGRPFIKGKR